MTTLSELQKLAEVVRDTGSYAGWEEAANPETILRLLDLVELQHEAIAILRLKTDPKYGLPIADKALTAYKEFGK